MLKKSTFYYGCLITSLGSLLSLSSRADYLALTPGAAHPALGFLLGKRVSSVVRLQRVEAPAGTSAPAGVGATVMMAGPAEQTISRVLAVKKGKGPDELLLEQTIRRVQLTIVSPLGRSVYDSDNAFERDAVTAALGQRYDPYVGKAHTSAYAGSAGAAPVPADPQFESVWTTNVPALLDTPALQGVVLRQLPPTLAVGSTWTDSVRLGAGLTINRYRVLTKAGDLLQLSLTSQLSPGAGGQQTSSSRSRAGTVSATSTVSAVAYEGELRVHQSSGFIEELHLLKQAAGAVSAAGQTLPNASRSKVDILNVMN